MADAAAARSPQRALVQRPEPRSRVLQTAVVGATIGTLSHGVYNSLRKRPVLYRASHALHRRPSKALAYSSASFPRRACLSILRAEPWWHVILAAGGFYFGRWLGKVSP